MQLEEKARELISKKYYSPVVVLNDNKNITLNSVLDTSNGTLFTICDSHYSFKDQEGNFWLTIPKKLIINDEQYYPVIGNRYICDGIKYSFRTKEVVIAMAIDYFKKHIRKDYTLKKKKKWHLFFCMGQRYVLPYKSFKSRTNSKIKFYISNN
ncbi:hypothetical protein KHA90_05830 [Flavobacterium psychroterrae]|uniref:Uncharacterized protein n=1 Tax=Flavobacterium psychroterrae TaxID=2133767 RepID=A0ABS5P8Q6_9FLAO|nr:hypothetical protein [Flavobacterium psychroterrae]MBS7230536.1 hypothetical protein [Flavobacterium psychroterrae]